MSYDLEKVLARASEDLERGTRGKTATESLEAYRRFRRLEEHRLRLRISTLPNWQSPGLSSSQAYV